MRVSACQPPPPPDKDQNTRSEEPGSCSPPLKAAGRGETSRQSTEGPVLPLGPQRTVSPLTTAQERRVPLPSRQPGGVCVCVCVCGGGSASLPSQTRGEGRWWCRSLFPHGLRGGGRGCVCVSIALPSRTRGGRMWGLVPLSLQSHGRGSVALPSRTWVGVCVCVCPVPLPSRTQERGKGGVGPSPLTEPGRGISLRLLSQAPGSRKRGESVRLPSQNRGGGRGGVGGISVPLPSRTPGGGGGTGLPLPSRARRPGQGQRPGGWPHRVPHEPLEAEALLLGGAPRDDERLRLLAGPGRPRGRGRRHAPTATAPRPAADVTPRDAPGLWGRRRPSWRRVPACRGRTAR